MPYLLAPEELGVLVGDGPDYRVDQLRDWLYRTPVLDAQDMTNLPGDLREKVDRPFGKTAIETVRGMGYRLEP